MYAAFAIGQKWDAAALLVSDKAGEVAKKKTEEMDVKELAQKDGYEFRVLMLGKVSGIKKTDATIEDLFPDDFFRECVKRAYGIMIRDEDLPTVGSTLISKRVEQILNDRYNRQLDKKLALAEILREFDSWNTIKDLPKGVSTKAKNLFSSINGAFNLWACDARSFAWIERHDRAVPLQSSQSSDSGVLLRAECQY